MISGNNKYWLSIEFILLFFGIPLLLYFDSVIIHPSSILLPLLIGIFLLLRYRTNFKWKELIYLKISKATLLRHLAIQMLVFVILFLAVWILIPEKLLNLPRGNMLIWVILSVFYPVFSAYAQEVIYRTFIFKRYNTLFPKPWMFILASAVTFSYVHIVYYSTVSIVLTFFAGIYLAKTYLDTRSVLFTSILHGILGNIVFTVGLGEYFWLDIMEYIQ